MLLKPPLRDSRVQLMQHRHHRCFKQILRANTLGSLQASHVAQHWHHIQLTLLSCGMIWLNAKAQKSCQKLWHWNVGSSVFKDLRSFQKWSRRFYSKAPKLRNVHESLRVILPNMTFKALPQENMLEAAAKFFLPTEHHFKVRVQYSEIPLEQMLLKLYS